MAQLNANMILADELDENNFIKKEHEEFKFLTKSQCEVKWHIVILSDVLFDIDEEVKNISVGFRMFYLGKDKKIKLEGNRLNFPIVEKDMLYTEITKPFNKKIFTKRTNIEVSTVFPGEGEYAMILLKNNENEDSDIDSEILDIKIISVQFTD